VLAPRMTQDFWSFVWTLSLGSCIRIQG
jgi:hypothetical protein